MKKNLDDLMGKFQSNCYPAMTDHLADILGVSDSSLQRLGLGYVPVVKFKKGFNYQGWWATPERGEDAAVVGISLRADDGTKVMYPASNHGFCYEVNPNHQAGAKGYEPGAHNWIRTMDAGVLCPVCGKPDGCLLSSDDTSDPKAVVCIRVHSEHPLRFGYLHIRKEAGQILGVNPLNDNGGPVLIVEGFSDTAAALDLGYDGLGRPSNLARLDMLADLVRGRSVIVLGENDRKPDGREPGKEGMIAAFQACRRASKDVTMLMPPEHVKDLRAWIVKYKLTRPEFERYLGEFGHSHHEDSVLPNPSPLAAAKAWLASGYKAAGRVTLRNYRGQWHRYRNGRYETAEEAALRSEIYNWSEGKLALHETANGETPKPLNAGPMLVNGILDASLSQAHIESATLPCWINGIVGPRPEDLIVFSNGMLDVPLYVAGHDAVLDLTPDFFTRFAAPYPFDPTAQCPIWLEFLNEVLDSDVSKIALLQEWFGYNLVPDTSMHKMLLMVGPPRSGKSTILNVLRDVIGPDQCASTTFRQLTTQFGMAPLIGCLSAIMADAHLSRHADGMASLEILKQIVAGDPQGVDVKYREGMPSIRLRTRFSMAVNELPELPDFSGAMIPRINAIDFKHSFIGREDFGLGDRLATETAGIAKWALEGLTRLRNQGRFTVPSSSLTILHEWGTLTNPISGFVEECTERSDAGLSKDELFDAYEAWRQERRIQPMTRSRFLERIKTAAPHIISTTFDTPGHKHSIFKGIDLRSWAKRSLLGKP